MKAKSVLSSLMLSTWNEKRLHLFFQCAQEELVISSFSQKYRFVQSASIDPDLCIENEITCDKKLLMRNFIRIGDPQIWMRLLLSMFCLSNSVCVQLFRVLDVWIF